MNAKLQLFGRYVWMVGLVVCANVGAIANAQQRQPPIHYFQNAALPPGMVGQGQLARDPRLNGHFQTVEVSGPEKVKVSIAINGTYAEPESNLLVGMLIGQVYQFKVTNIPFNEGLEVFPTIELVNRLYTPEGKQTRFPIPVELTAEEIEMALRGMFITRVIYLEDPNQALPVVDKKGEQRSFDVAVGEDPLYIADKLGKPMAILRMGSRVPDENALSKYGSPPVIKFVSRERKSKGNVDGDTPAEPSNPDGAIIRESRNYPRMPLPGEAPRSIKIPPVIRTR